MADTVGVIAQASALIVGTTTIYTVPTSKALIFKPQFIGQANAGGSTFVMAVNGAQIFQNAVVGSSYFWSSMGILYQEAATFPTGETLVQTVAPGPTNYYASAGQTITYGVTVNALISLNMQLVGTLIDV